VYAVLFVKPVTFIGEEPPDTVTPPGLDVTVYPVITLPPLFVGATNATLAEAFPAVATTPVGAPGTIIVAVGVTAVEAAEAAELPTELVATTVKVYAVLFVKPVTFIGEEPPDTVTPPGLDVTV
jgi:hypothetical protein